MNCLQRRGGSYPHKYSHPLNSVLSSELYIDLIAFNACDGVVNARKNQAYSSMILLGGSMPERLALKHPLSDMDIMLVGDTGHVVVDDIMLFPVSLWSGTSGLDSKKEMYQLLRVYDKRLLPGYNILCDLKQRESFLMASTYLEKHQEMYKKLSSPSVTATSHGPAIIFSDTPNVDVVKALYYPGWPTEALPWLFRYRCSGWPNKDLIHATVNTGCHLVPSSHPTSELKHFEFRLSFSMAEVKLARSLSPGQRMAYLTFKAICKTKLNIESYHLKTVFFWMCESIPRKRWTARYQMDRVLDLFDALLHYLIQKNLPNYFIPENNMINHLHTDSIVTTLKAITKLLKHGLLSAIKDYMKTYPQQISGIHIPSLDCVREMVDNLEKHHIVDFCLVYSNSLLEKEYTVEAKHFINWACYVMRETKAWDEDVTRTRHIVQLLDALKELGIGSKHQFSHEK